MKNLSLWQEVASSRRMFFEEMAVDFHSSLGFPKAKGYSNRSMPYLVLVVAVQPGFASTCPTVNGGCSLLYFRHAARSENQSQIG